MHFLTTRASLPNARQCLQPRLAERDPAQTATEPLCVNSLSRLTLRG